MFRFNRGDTMIENIVYEPEEVTYSGYTHKPETNEIQLGDIEQDIPEDGVPF